MTDLLHLQGQRSSRTRRPWGLSRLFRVLRPRGKSEPGRSLPIARPDCVGSFRWLMRWGGSGGMGRVMGGQEASELQLGAMTSVPLCPPKPKEFDNEGPGVQGRGSF